MSHTHKFHIVNQCIHMICLVLYIGDLECYSVVFCPIGNNIKNIKYFT